MFTCRSIASATSATDSGWSVWRSRESTATRRLPGGNCGGGSASVALVTKALSHAGLVITSRQAVHGWAFGGRWLARSSWLSTDVDVDLATVHAGWVDGNRLDRGRVENSAGAQIEP